MVTCIGYKIHVVVATWFSLKGFLSNGMVSMIMEWHVHTTKSHSTALVIPMVPCV